VTFLVVSCELFVESLGLSTLFTLLAKDPGYIMFIEVLRRLPFGILEYHRKTYNLLVFLVEICYNVASAKKSQDKQNWLKKCKKKLVEKTIVMKSKLKISSVSLVNMYSLNILFLSCQINERKSDQNLPTTWLSRVDHMRQL
jgi:hypothetical protein